MSFSGTGLACRRAERLVFANLDFSIEEGDALVLTGPNGSGKSSLLRLMAGLIKPFAGQLRWNGAAVGEDPAAHRGRLAYLGHLDALKPTMSAAETIRFWSGLRGCRTNAEAALASFGIADRADLPVRFLSAGQRRRVGLARIVASDAKLWLLDEPSVGLDHAALRAFEAALAAHRAQGGMVVAATHMPIALPGASALDLAAFPAPAEAA